MIRPEYNLIDEPWILVLDRSATTKEVSLKELFSHAHEYLSLAGETPTQNISVLRLLLAILDSVFSANFDPSQVDGKDDSLTDELGELLYSDYQSNPIERWSILWNMNRLPWGLINDYLEKYRERFYLFHPEYPFYQVPDLTAGTKFNAAKLNGELLESNHKLRLFPSRAGEQKTSLTYAEAARWILHMNNYDDTASKPTISKLPSPGAGWLGQLGNIMAKGNNLFETLMLNCVMADRNGDPWPEGSAVWEKPVQTQERRNIVMPETLKELYTLQSRRLRLEGSDGKVTGVILQGGDFFSKENAFIEPFTIWRRINNGKKNQPVIYVPKRHEPGRQLWRDFSDLLSAEAENRRPGIIEWLGLLKNLGYLEQRHCHFQTAGISYGDKDFFANDILNDSLSFSSGFLDQMNGDWTTKIIEEIKYTEKLIHQYGKLAKDLALASGDATGESEESRAKEEGYFLIDGLFRDWISAIDPKIDEKKKVCDEWWESAQATIRKMGKIKADQATPNAMIGRMIEGKNHNAFSAYNTFLRFTERAQIRIH